MHTSGQCTTSSSRICIRQNSGSGSCTIWKLARLATSLTWQYTSAPTPGIDADGQHPQLLPPDTQTKLAALTQLPALLAPKPTAGDTGPGTDITTQTRCTSTPVPEEPPAQITAPRSCKLHATVDGTEGTTVCHALPLSAQTFKGTKHVCKADN